MLFRSTNIEKTLGDKKTLIDSLFSKKNGYTDEDLQKLGIEETDLREYADLGLGIQIRDCIKERGQCSFEAEL